MALEPIHAQHPARKAWRFIESSGRSPDALSPEQMEARFDELARGLFAWQFEQIEPYRKLCLARSCTPARVRDWSQIPTVSTAAFKECEFTCLPAADRPFVFHSSGTTTHQPSRHFHNELSLELYHAALLPWFRRHFPTTGDPPHLLALTPPGQLAPHSSLVHMLEVIRTQGGSLDSWFGGGVRDDGAWALDAGKVVAWLNRYAVLNQAVIVAGTAFNFVHLLDWMISRDARVQLPPGSAVLETGGYKGRSRSLPQAELHALIGDRLGVPPRDIVCEYGMCELSSQAYDRIAGETDAARIFHFPPWVRTRIVSVEDGRPVGEGQPGLLQVFDLANAFSVLAIQTTDLALQRDGGFELIGRAGLVEPRGCSLMPA